jgi:hypothetical protein
VPWRLAPALSDRIYRAAARSVVALFSEIERAEAPG